MKRYRFPLGAVLRIRRTERDQAARAVADAERDAAAAERAREHAIAVYGQVVPNGGVISTQQLLSQRLIHELGADAVVAADARKESADGELLARRAALAAAASAVKALEELEARGRVAHKAAAMKQEAREVDDLVVSRHGRSDG